MGKKLIEAKKKIDSNKLYSLKDALNLAKETSYTKFDASIDLAFKLNLDVRQADQQLRGSIPLPKGIGKVVKVLVATNEPNLIQEAKDANSDFIANTEDLSRIMKDGKFNFDVIVADPKMMPIIGRYGKILGPKGLMPNPKTGTVTPNIKKAVSEIKSGKANYRTDKNGIVHVQIGKASFKIDDLLENAKTIIDTIKKIKPSSVKGLYIQNLITSSTMGPSIKIKID